MNHAGFVYANVRLRPTNAYDIDPSAGSTIVPGFNELAAIYSTYRVNSFRQSTTFVNLEAFPVTVYLGLANLDPTANTTLYQNYLSSRRTRREMVGIAASGSSHRTLVMGGSYAGFGGVPNSGVLDYTSAAVTTGPLNNIWTIAGVVSQGGAVLVNGVMTTQTVDFNITFFELQNPTA